MDARSLLDTIWIVPALPLLGAVVLFLFGKQFSEPKAGWLATGLMGLAFGWSVVMLAALLDLPDGARLNVVNVWTWLPAGALTVHLGFLADPLSVTWILLVTGVGSLIHLYAIGYMHGDPRYARFFAYFNLFAASMLVLVLASSFLLTFLGWEGVGLCSYLLIGFWYERRRASSASVKAFVTNRVGDFGFMVAMFFIVGALGSLDYTAMNVGAHGVAQTTATAIAVLLFLACVGKSAQIGLHVWLPDAMEGPTPVSALIHAATMVTAGVFLVCRANPFFLRSGDAMTVVAVFGAVTAIFAGTVALVQPDIKRVLAYSTVSQLGYMFLALGVGAFAAGVFHLMTHAFFKALLFLGSGSVIHAMHHEQDMRKMGALWNRIPITFKTMFVGTLAIAGTPLLSGFFSKDEILWQAFSSPHGHIVLWLIGVTVAGMTSFYMFRLLFMTFFGESRVDHHTDAHIHESPKSMTIPLIVLAVGAVLAGYIGLPAWLGGSAFERFLEPVFEPLPIQRAEVAHHGSGLEIGIAAVSVAVALLGFFLAYSKYYKRSWEEQREIRQYGPLYGWLLNKWKIDELYDALFVNRAKGAGVSMWKFDSKIVDGVVNGSAWGTVETALGSSWWDRWIVDGLVRFIGGFIKTVSWPLRLIQTGYVQNYALVMVLGVLVFIGYVLWGTP